MLNKPFLTENYCFVEFVPGLSVIVQQHLLTNQISEFNSAVIYTQCPTGTQFPSHYICIIKISLTLKL